MTTELTEEDLKEQYSGHPNQFDRNRPAAVHVPPTTSSATVNDARPWTPEEERAERARLEKPEAPRKFLARYWATLDAARLQTWEASNQRQTYQSENELLRGAAVKLQNEALKERDELRNELIERDALLRNAERMTTGYCKRIEDISAERDKLIKELDAARSHGREKYEEALRDEDISAERDKLIKELDAARSHGREKYEEALRDVDRMRDEVGRHRNALREITISSNQTIAGLEKQITDLQHELQDRHQMELRRDAYIQELREEQQRTKKLRLSDYAKMNAEQKEQALTELTGGLRKEQERQMGGYLKGVRETLARDYDPDASGHNESAIYDALDSVLTYLEKRRP
jgi:chromosome segregation ATPase